MTDPRVAISNLLASMHDSGDTATDALVSLSNELERARTALNDLQIPDPWVLVDNTGATDATVAIQRAISLGWPIPAGRYAVQVNKLVATRSVSMDPGAVLVAIPNGLQRYVILEMHGVDLTLDGGVIYGDRLRHDYSEAGTHEHGTGVLLNGDRIVVNDTVVQQCTGDAWGASGADIVMNRCIGTSSRRNNASLYNVVRFRANDCQFTFAGQMGTNPGTAPMAGVDVEPDRGAASDIVFTRCRISNNATSGFLAWSRSGTGVTIDGIKLVDCVIENNANGVETKGLGGRITNVEATGCTLAGYKGAAFKLGAGSSASNISGNTMRSVLRSTTSTLSGIATKYDIVLGAQVNNPDGSIVPKATAVVGVNTYAGPTA